MKLAVLALVLSAPQAPPTEWSGSFAAGLAEVRARAESGAHDSAQALALELAAPHGLAQWCEQRIADGGWRARAGRAAQVTLDTLALAGPPPAVRAEAHHARAAAFALAADAAGDETAEAEVARTQARAGAFEALERARLLAGPGELRRVATSDQGALLVAAAEELRAKIPEVSGAPPPAPPPAGPTADEPAPPDPLQLARAAYLAARERLIECLRMDWRAPDAQANVELVQRRLRELDEIERKRKEEQRQQEEEQREKEKQQQQSGEEGDKPPDPKEGEEPKPPEEPQKEPESQEPKEPEKPDEKPESKEPQPKDPGEAQPMSREELQKLLERLQQIEDAREELERRMQRQRRIEVLEDW